MDSKEKYHQLRRRFTVYPGVDEMQHDITHASAWTPLSRQTVMTVPTFDHVMDDGFAALVEHAGNWVVLFNTTQLPCGGRRNLMVFWSHGDPTLDMPLGAPGLYEVVPSVTDAPPTFPMPMHLARPSERGHTLRTISEQTVFEPVATFILPTAKDFGGVIGQMVAQANPMLQREALGVLDLLRRMFTLPTDYQPADRRAMEQSRHEY